MTGKAYSMQWLLSLILCAATTAVHSAQQTKPLMHHQDAYTQLQDTNPQMRSQALKWLFLNRPNLLLNIKIAHYDTTTHTLRLKGPIAYAVSKESSIIDFFKSGNFAFTDDGNTSKQMIIIGTNTLPHLSDYKNILYDYTPTYVPGTNIEITDHNTVARFLNAIKRTRNKTEQ